MQTLKTAAIVVLLMTVMYGAYVSLTTPPESLPADAEEMLVMNEEGILNVDAGLPESLGSLEINSGLPLADSDVPPLPEAPQSSGVAALDLANDDSFPPMPEVGSPAPPSGAQEFRVSDAEPNESGVVRTLSDVTPPDAMGNPPQSPGYPRTSNTFELPDPNSVAGSFGAPGEVVEPSQTDLALTSGMSDADGPGAPPTSSGVAPISSSLESRPVGTSDIGVANAIRTADEQYRDDKRMDALATLSIFYNTPNLSGEQRSELLSRLDPLAREVIYSQRHLLEQPYRVGQNETLMEIAARYEVPWQLLANINQIEDPVTILPGTELKVVRGPFRAEVSLSMKELTLFLNDMYAGRFPIGVGTDPSPKPGTFTVQDKQTSKTFYDAAGSPVPPGSPDNPYGEVWIDLGGQLSIHGSPSTTNPTEKGCISLAADFADDLYGILSQGSSVTIRR